MKRELMIVVIMLVLLGVGLSGCVDNSKTLKVRVTNNYIEELYFDCFFYEDTEITDRFTPYTYMIDVGDSYTFEHTFEDTTNNAFIVAAANETEYIEGTDKIAFEKYDVPDEDFTLIDVILDAEGTLTSTLNK